LYVADCGSLNLADSIYFAPLVSFSKSAIALAFPCSALTLEMVSTSKITPRTAKMVRFILILFSDGRAP